MKKWKSGFVYLFVALMLIQVGVGYVLIQHVVKAENVEGDTLIAKESSWKYWDQGTYPGDTWRDGAFDDASWKSGKGALGYNPKNLDIKINTTISYGADEDKKYPVSFFRKNFEVKDADKYLRANLALKADDSAVIYVNGKEVKRVRLADGVINFGDYSGQQSSDAVEYEGIKLGAIPLQEGTNTIAIAVFQQKGSSSDVTFDAELTGFVTPEETVVDEDYAPSKIAVTFFGNTQTQKGFTWHTKLDAKSDLQYVKTVGSVVPSFAGAQLVTGKSEANDIAIGGFSHQVVAKYLDPGTTYWYRVGDKARDKWSEPAQFTTQKRDTKAFDFLYVTDSQGSSEEEYSWTDATLNKGFAMYPNAEFILQTGDLVNTSSSPAEWGWLFGTSQNLLSNTTIAAATGNHDAFNNSFRQHFYYDHPANANNLNKGVYYSFDYGPAHFIMLNTNDQDSRALDPVQLAWLKEDAKQARADGAKWLVVAFHKGIYTVASHMTDTEIVTLRDQLAPVFDELGIDIVLQGHDHSYFRSQQMKGKSPIAPDAISRVEEDKVLRDVDPGGQSYHVINTSGYKFYQPQSESKMSAAGVYPVKYAQPMLQMFAGISFTEDRFTYKAYTYDAKTANAVRATAEASLFDTYGILKTDRAKAVAAEIDALPTKVALADKATVLAVKAAYDNLDTTLQKYVLNYNSLTSKLADLNALEAEQPELEPGVTDPNLEVPTTEKPVIPKSPETQEIPISSNTTSKSVQPVMQEVLPNKDSVEAKSYAVTGTDGINLPSTGDADRMWAFVLLGGSFLVLGSTIWWRRKLK
ncbi:LPXTG cell wall anchor domain-containing protein [Listeria rocourtiae]|uniref:fibronectin type III domain-containing protein n=1 Tax=Listeria rocourtiae TaxID=647910 RepID=UPI00162491EF|nr:fibronectin type III domain-containing protein [Listeria rocourtiae]MBC1434923.1 LPXTG cell wall anchor domain-containing protein [Listeria rocourtiae]